MYKNIPFYFLLILISTCVYGQYVDASFYNNEFVLTAEPEVLKIKGKKQRILFKDDKSEITVYYSRKNNGTEYPENLHDQVIIFNLRNGYFSYNWLSDGYPINAEEINELSTNGYQIFKLKYENNAGGATNGFSRIIDYYFAVKNKKAYLLFELPESGDGHIVSLRSNTVFQVLNGRKFINYRLVSVDDTGNYYLGYGIDLAEYLAGLQGNEGKSVFRINLEFNSEQNKAIVNDSGVRLRGDYNLQAGIVTKLQRNSEIWICYENPYFDYVENSYGFWVKVETIDGRTGWIWGKYLNL